MITELSTVQARIQEEVSALDIVVELKTTDDILQNVNYVQIPKLKRKYFVVDKDILTNGTCNLRVKSDCK